MSAYIQVYLAFFGCAIVHSCAIHYIGFDLVFQVCIRRFLFGWLQPLSSHVQVFHYFIPWFLKVFLDEFSMRPGHVFRKSCLIDLRIIALVGLKSAAHKYWASYDFGFCARMLFTTFPDCYVPRGTSHITVFYFWWLWWFLLHSYILKFLAFLVWWCIHHHIRTLMLLMGLYVFLEKCWYTSLACLTW